MNHIPSRSNHRDAVTEPIPALLTRMAGPRKRLRFWAFARTHPRVAAVIEEVRRAHLSFLEAEALLDLAEAAASQEKRRIEGMFVELGCALGGSAVVLASAKGRKRPFFIYDTFGLIPPPSERDGPDVHGRYDVIASGKATGGAGQTYYGYRENLLTGVVDTFARFGLPTEEHGIHLVKGLFRDTLRIQEPVALAHFDCDWYESVKAGLEVIEPNLVKGGILVIDDYDTWSGCRRAVDEYFRVRRGEFKFLRKARLHIVRV